ncbi:MAG: flagellar hook-basal body protein [Oscillospiraceae bacterium]|nr:flagellar hook-basal body protein [Oscillospiraceae bacterium]
MSIAFYTGVAGMLASQSFMDATANNMANVNTVGYKTQNATFEDLLYTKMNIHSNYYNREDDDPNGEVVEGEGAPVMADGSTDSHWPDGSKVYDLVGHGVKIGSVDLMYHQGGFLNTERKLDFAIDGDGLFAVENNLGEVEYTRNGRFNLSVEGRKLYLVNAQGYHVLDRKGKQVTLALDENDNPDYDGLVEKLGIYYFDNPFGLTPTDSGSFLESENSGEAVAAKAGDERSKVLQQFLENSNVQLSDQMVNLIQAQRSFQLNAKVVQTADAIEEMINNLR